jgi:hypothetical protein
MDRYINLLTSHSNEFDNVKDLILCTREIRNHSSYYFRNVRSLTLTSEFISGYIYDNDDDDETDRYRSVSVHKIS